MPARALAEWNSPCSEGSIGLSAAAHSLKAAQQPGARHLAAVCASLEEHAKAGELNEAANSFDELKSEFQQVTEILLAEMQQ